MRKFVDKFDGPSTLIAQTSGGFSGAFRPTSFPLFHGIVSDSELEIDMIGSYLQKAKPLAGKKRSSFARFAVKHRLSPPSKE